MGFEDLDLTSSIQQYNMMNMMPQAQGMPRINPERVADSMVMRSAIRQGMYGPGARPTGAGRMARIMGGAAGMPQLGGGLDPSSVTDPGVANDALSQYGMQLPTHTNPFLFFKDQNQDGSSTWAGNHPRVAKAIEGAMIGATTPGGATIGENISNVAKTVLGIPGMYRQNQAAQMQAPFDAAKQIAGLQDDQINMQTKLASAFHMYATGQAALDKPTKAYGGSVYQDGNKRPYQINTVTGKPEALDGRSDPLQFDDSTKVGTPGKPAAPGALPKGVSSVAERNAWTNAVQSAQKNGRPVPQTPQDIPNWSSMVNQETQRIARSGGYGGAAGRGQGAQDNGSLSEVDKKNLGALEDTAKVAEAHAKEKVTRSQFKEAQDPDAAMRAEVADRQQKAKDARTKYNQAVANTQSQQPNSKLDNQSKGIIFHPDGRLEIPPPGQVK